MFNNSYVLEKVYMVTWYKNDASVGKAYFENEEDAVAYRKEKWHEIFEASLEEVTILREDSEEVSFIPIHIEK